MAARLETVGGHILRYGLVGMILWFGASKFTEAEAKAIEPLVAHSPLLSWLYGLMDVHGVSRLIGSLEILLAALIGPPCALLENPTLSDYTGFVQASGVRPAMRNSRTAEPPGPTVPRRNPPAVAWVPRTLVFGRGDRHAPG